MERKKIFKISLGEKKNNKKLRNSIKSKQYNKAIFLGIGSILGAYIWPIVGLFFGIFGLIASRKAVKEKKKSKLPFVINIIGITLSSMVLCFLLYEINL